MATWLTHIRVAEIVVNKKLHVKDAPLFFVGSIAPDNGLGADISHQCVNADKATCDIKRFYRDYILNKASDDLDFYIGYYVHLYTDLIWQRHKILPLIKQNKDIKKIKQIWRSVDVKFLSENNGYYPITLISQANNLEKNWFDYYDIHAVKNLRDDIIQLSSQQSMVQVSVDAQNEINEFINECANHIVNN